MMVINPLVSVCIIHLVRGLISGSFFLQYAVAVCVIVVIEIVGAILAFVYTDEAVRKPYYFISFHQ